MNAAHPLVPVTLLTGFLGSGKTTVLNHLVQQPEMARTLVIINEFGDIGLDHFLVAHSSDETVTEMSSGCLCCTIRSDLVKTLRDITWRFAREGRRQFDRVVIETTGLADPVPILHTLAAHPFMTGHYRLDGVLTVVDLAAAGHTLDAHPEAQRQIAVADRLLLTKEDLVSSQETASVIERLQAINPAARQIRVRQGSIEANDILDIGFFASEKKLPEVQRWLNEQADQDEVLANDEVIHAGHAIGEHRHHHHDVNRHNEHIRAYSVIVDEPIDERALQRWKDDVEALMGAQMLRIKALVNLAGKSRPMVLHGVQNVFHAPVYLKEWPSEDKRSRFVFITQDIDRAAIENTLDILIRQA